MTDDRVVLLHPGRKAEEPALDSTPETVEAAPAPTRLTVGIEVPADRRSVLLVQTIAQLATLAKEAGVPLDDGLAEGAERLARNLRGAGLALPAHLEDALEDIARALSPPEPEEPRGTVLPFRVVSADD
ncbi:MULTISPECIES: hypothetical protein [Thalassobaculum]|uniref:Uncharacterized protein n=1 Tax=Thalassobaculum litoreum DSM 18839 TaxID=1123362 RepID=A0A8G2BKS2_9PROT|nr:MULTISPECIES: hypothetical protein [Thalassobaculum]SDG04237.1 hypothetical protein SAMN05660686_03172 [Thalassobaculum litoreum DSM 18839]